VAASCYNRNAPRPEVAKIETDPAKSIGPFSMAEGDRPVMYFRQIHPVREATFSVVDAKSAKKVGVLEVVKQVLPPTPVLAPFDPNTWEIRKGGWDGTVMKDANDMVGFKVPDGDYRFTLDMVAPSTSLENFEKGYKTYWASPTIVVRRDGAVKGAPANPKDHLKGAAKVDPMADPKIDLTADPKADPKVDPKADPQA
jgi:hypothetical protein